MRIAYFTDTYLPQINGVTNTLEKLGSYLSHSNIKHMFFAPEYTGAKKNNREKLVSRFKSINFPLYPECRLSIPLYPNLYRIAEDFKPDLIHLVTPLGIGLMGLKYAYDAGIPVVASFHTNFDAYLKYYRLEQMEDIVWNFFRWFHNKCILNFCPSMDTLRSLEAKGVENLRLWSRGIDTNKFNPRHRSAEMRKRLGGFGKTLFLYVGRIAAEKDLDILSESIKEINTRFPGKAQFAFVGDGPYTGQLAKALPENAVFTGYLKGHELAEAYASCDVFVFPSGTETFGNVVLEAMASGLPVTVVNSGGVRDSVIDGCNGLVCKPRDAQSFAAAMARFINEDGLAERLGRNAREYTVSKSWDSIFSRLVSDYDEVLCESESGKRGAKLAKIHKSA